MNGTTRRGALAGGVALLLARPAAAAAQADPAPVLRDLIAREEAAARAYRAVGMERLAAQEEQHAAALRPQLEALGQPVRPTGGVGPDAGSRTAAIALEEELIAAYRRALEPLADPAIRRTAATIMAGHAQHLVVLHADPLDALR